MPNSDADSPENSSVAPQPAGARVGAYRLIEPLSRGGMGEAWVGSLAHASGFEKKVVVKLILPHLSSEALFVQMFLREARLAALLHHPNIVQVYELGEDAGRYYMIMEYVDGLDLYNLTRGRDVPRLPPALACNILAQVARGLAHAHFSVEVDGHPCAIIHRDITPSNVMVGYDGTVKVLDFGIAKALTELDAFTRTHGEHRKGKTGYIAPELGLGGAIDGRADIYACGVVLWEMLTGESYAPRALRPDLRVPPSRIVAGLPPELDRICAKAMAEKPHERYASASDLASELQQLASTTSAVVEWMRQIPRPQRAVVASGAVVERTKTADPAPDSTVVATPAARMKTPLPPTILETRVLPASQAGFTGVSQTGQSRARRLLVPIVLVASATLLLFAWSVRKTRLDTVANETRRAHAVAATPPPENVPAQPSDDEVIEPATDVLRAHRPTERHEAAKATHHTPTKALIQKANPPLPAPASRTQERPTGGDHPVDPFR